MADHAFSQCRNVVGFLADGPDRDIYGTTVMAGFTIITDTTVSEGGRGAEGRIGVVVACETILLRGQMGG